MRRLKDKTNSKTERVVEEKQKPSEKQEIIGYLTGKASVTADFDLKYDLTKCIEILQGKENQEFIDIKESLYEVLMEKETLFKENCELVCELDMLKEQLKNSN
ncbi:hypothetical protein NUSPORA_01936 [Nucleospora cyclopteri]